MSDRLSFPCIPFGNVEATLVNPELENMEYVLMLRWQQNLIFWRKLPNSV